QRNFSLARKQRRAFAQSALSGDLREIRIVGALRQMRQNDVPRLSVKAIEQPFRDVFIRQVTKPRKNSLLQFPRIMLDSLEHIARMVWFDHDRRAASQPLGDQRRDVAKVHQRRDLHAVVRGGEPKVIHGIVRDRERMKFDLADLKVASGIYLDRAIAQSIGAPPRLVAGNIASLTNVSLSRLA